MTNAVLKPVCVLEITARGHVNVFEFSRWQFKICVSYRTSAISSYRLLTSTSSKVKNERRSTYRPGVPSRRTQRQLYPSVSAGCTNLLLVAAVCLKLCNCTYFTQILVNSNFRSELVWHFTQRRKVVWCRRFGTTCRSHLQGSSSFQILR
jgi:hypothetical protein